MVLIWIVSNIKRKKIFLPFFFVVVPLDRDEMNLKSLKIKFIYWLLDFQDYPDFLSQWASF